MSENPDVLFDCDDQMFPDYHLQVVRADAGAHLTVTFKGEMIHEQEVPLAYGAQFGVDVMDFNSWGQIACNVVDKHLAGR